MFNPLDPDNWWNLLMHWRFFLPLGIGVAVGIGLYRALHSTPDAGSTRKKKRRLAAPFQLHGHSLNNNDWPLPIPRIHPLAVRIGATHMGNLRAVV